MDSRSRSIRAGDPKAAGEPSTRDRILELSRNLFNRDGVQGTAVLRIASELSISPGNLTYYFRSKSDIVHSLAVELEKDIAAALNGLTSPVKPAEVVSSMASILQTMWASRFFFNSALHVSSMNEALADKFQQVCSSILNVVEDYNSELIRRREMRAPRVKYGVKLLCANIIAVWLQWLRLQNLRTPDALRADDEAIGWCLRHHFAVVDPYMSARFSEAIHEEVDRQFFA